MSDWIRVNRTNKCPICGKDSWCTYTDSSVICMRVQSGREVPHKDGSVGWLHRLSETTQTPVRAVRREPEVTINARKLMEEFLDDTDFQVVDRLAQDLKVKASSLRAIGCAWAGRHGAFAFPMHDAWGNVVGIRLRASSGRKWAVTGSHQGIFCPPHQGERRGYICEGPTDTAAALSLGLYALGRPSCSGGVSEVITTFKRNGVTEAVIVADNDDPGIRGALMLQNHLPFRSCVLILPAKDVREAVSLGMTLEDVEEQVSNLVWKQPKEAE